MNVRLISYLMTALVLLASSCSKDGGVQGNDQGGGLGISGITIPAEFAGREGNQVTCWAKGILETDRLTLEGTANNFNVDFEILSPSRFSITIPEGMVTGMYDLVLTRDGVSETLGQIYISIIAEGDIPDKAGMNVKGIVHCGGEPVPGVVVSDGVQVTETDANGCWWLSSDKTYGLVFISTPEGYVCNCSGVLPGYFQYLKQPVNVVERLDFELNATPDQTNHRLLVLGDMHLANRSNRDLQQFGEFVADINEVVASTSVPVYGLTLGDMTFDSFWYTNLYFFEDYLRDAAMIKNLPIYHTIGNHDHELGKRGAYPAGEFATTVKYRNSLGPTWYSFNIGRVHYVVLDDIYSTNPGDGTFSYENTVSQEQIEWLKKDLSYVDRTKTIVVASHAQFHGKDGSVSLKNYREVMDCLDGFSRVHIFTGHTHLVYNVEDEKMFEHNAGAVCATWWWTGYHSDIHIAQDGAPGGYTIVDFTGGEPQWQFKGTGHPVGFQFRCYDGNSIQINSGIYCKDESSANRSKFDSYASQWKDKSSDNYVYINVWNWDPEWTVEVTEEGAGSLDVTQVTLKDPLHLIAYTAPSISQPTFATSDNLHFFRVQASKPNSTLDIKVTDRFGNVYTERMERPRPFSLAQYR